MKNHYKVSIKKKHLYPWTDKEVYYGEITLNGKEIFSQGYYYETHVHLIKEALDAKIKELQKPTIQKSL